MLAEEGPAFPAHYVSVWARQIGLKRPPGHRVVVLDRARAFSVPACKRKAAARKAAGLVVRARRPMPKPMPAPVASDPEAAPVALLPPGTIRHTPALAAALDLVAHGLPPEAIRERVKLTVVEFAKVRDVARAAAHG